MPKSDRGSPSLVPKGFTRDRKRVVEFVRQGQALAQVLGDAALSGEMEQLAASALKPFLFVVVGEVKSGKSSLINALLEAPVCAVDSAPCTDRVQEINYGVEKQRTEVSEFEEHLQLPHDILRHISIVDTPGTNSIISGHQIITENYIPQSDLLLFVFFAKNPYTGSAWDFLHHIRHDWQRSTLFVLQQADLLEAEELERTLALVKQRLTEEGIAKPVVFATSVQTGAGLDTLRDYLRTRVVKGRQFNKGISLTHKLLRFLQRMEDALQDHLCLLQHDHTLLDEFEQLASGTNNEADRVYTTMAGTAQGHAAELERWLDTHFGDAAGPTTAGTDSSYRLWLSPKNLLGKAKGVFAGSVALRDALTGGWETPLRVRERFSQLQGQLIRCLYQARLRSLDLQRHHKRQALRLLDAIAVEPSCLAKMPEDNLALERRQTLREVRDKVGAIKPQGSSDPFPRLSAMGNHSLWSHVQRLIQAGTGLFCLVVGYTLDGLFGALFFGFLGYLGVGYALVARNREGVNSQARQVLKRGLADFDQRLKTSLMGNPTKTNPVLQDALGRCEANLVGRRTKIDELQTAIQALCETVERHESDAWLNAMQDE